MQSAVALIRMPRMLLEIDGAGHDFIPKKGADEWAASIVEEFQTFLKRPAQTRQAGDL